MAEVRGRGRQCRVSLARLEAGTRLSLDQLQALRPEVRDASSGGADDEERGQLRLAGGA